MEVGNKTTLGDKELTERNLRVVNDGRHHGSWQ